MNHLLLQSGDTFQLESGDRFALAGPVFRLAGAAQLQMQCPEPVVGRTRPCAGDAAIQIGLEGKLARLGKVEIVLDWDESPNADVAAYNVYRAMGEPVRLDAPYESVATPPWTDTVLEDWTGVITYLVRAVDAGGKEEANIREVLVVPVEAGTIGVPLPAEPRIVEARPIAGGRIELEWLYDPAYEHLPAGGVEGLGPGAAHEARIYWDGGTGDIDFSEPHATVPMNNPTVAARFTWRSDPLTDGQTYRFTVRTATAAHPGGTETSDVCQASAVANSSEPSVPVLQVRLA
ncbi:MAG: hypothetical protein ACLFWL_09070 [Candidatus Brocadiia bacterium]